MMDSSTLINKEKSNIFIFSTPRDSQFFLSCLMRFNIGTPLKNYLAMALAFNSLKTYCWKYLLVKIQVKLSRWVFHVLNLVGRTMLVKVILQSILIYQLSRMATPKTFSSTMVDIFINFLWKGAQRERN